MYFYGYGNRCCHSKVDTVCTIVTRFKRSEDRDVLDAYTYSMTIDICSMCGKENAKLGNELSRSEGSDCPMSNITRYRALIDSGFVLE